MTNLLGEKKKGLRTTGAKIAGNRGFPPKKRSGFSPPPPMKIGG